MEVKKGYKQTEIGLIPDDWLDPQLQEITEYNAPICYGIVQVRKSVPNGVPVLAIKNLNLDYVSDIHLASIEVERPYIRSRVQPKDVLVSVKGTTGRVGIVPAHFRGNISRDIARIRVQKEIDPRFVFQILQSEIGQRRMVTAAVGTTRMELSISILKQVRIPLPPTKAEQAAIAEVLSDADALIESLETLLAKKRQVKQGAMSELLSGERHLLGFSGEEKKSLIRICEIEKGEQLNRDTLSESGDYPVWNGGMEPSGYTDKWNTEKDTITISEGGNSCGFVNFVAKKFWRGGHCYALKRINSNVFQPYLYQYLKHREKDIMALRVGSGLPNIQRARLSGFEIYLPTLPEQTAIAEILSDMDAEIRAVEEKLSKARRVKAGMMSALLTGKVRLVEI